MLLAALMWGHASPVHAAPPRSGPDATPASGAETGTGTPGTGLATVPAQATEELDWAEMARELGDATKRQATLDELRTVQPFPAAAWVALLSHSDLSVRMGALEVLEDLAGADLDFDPWETDRTVQAEALARWQAWARSGAGKAPLVAAGAALHPEQLRDYLQDILAGDAAKAERSITKLRPYANQVIGEIERFLTEQSTLLDGARGRLKEAQYRLLLEGSPAAGDAARLARMLVFGNRDERVEGLEGISKAGSRCLPILREKLTDRDALVRERALDIFFEAGGTGGLPHIEAHLAKEKDENVIHAAIRGFGKTESAISTRLLTGYLNHENEDLVAAALLSLSLQKTAAKAAKSQILNCTKNPSWRVRAAALQCAAKAQLGPLPAEAVALLKDEDSFVRQAAVLAIAAGSGSRGGGAFDSGLGGILSKVVGGGSGGTTTDALCDAFEADDELKGTVIKAFAQMEKPLPDRIVKQFPKLSPELLAFGLSNFRTHESSSLELLLRYAMDANPDIACSALRVLAREKPLMEEVEPLLASVLAGGDRARQEAVVEYLEFYPFENKPNRRAMEEALQELTAGQSPAPVAPAVPHAGAVDPAPTKAAVPASPADRLHEAFFGGTRPAGEKAAAPEPAAAAPAPPSLAERLREAFLSVAAPSVSQDPTVRTDIPAGPAPVATASRVGPGSLEAALDALAATSSAPTGQGSTLAILAAQRLIEGGYAVGAHHFVRWWPALNVQHRAELASALSRQPRPGTLALWQRLLRDPSREIRRKAVASAFYEEEIPAPIKLVFLELLRKDTPLEAADLYQSRLESLSSQTETRTMMAEQARLLMADGRADRQVLACIMLGNRIRTADEALLASASVSPHFWVRRAAIYSMGRRNRALLEERAGVLASDTSAWVREALPVSLIPTGWAWHHHFDDNTSLENESYDSSPPPNRGLSEPLIAVLRQLATDREDHVRLAAMTALLTHREEVQLPTFLDLLDRAPNRTELSVALADFVENHYHRLGKGLLPLVGKLDWSKTPPDRYAAVQRHFGHEAAQSRADFAAYVTAGAEGGKAPASSEPQFSPEGVHSSAAAAAAGDGERDLSQAPVTVHFFHNPGCHECDRVRKDLASLAREFKGMKVQEHNIRDPEAVLLNEALSRRGLGNAPQRSRGGSEPGQRHPRPARQRSARGAERHTAVAGRSTSTL